MSIWKKELVLCLIFACIAFLSLTFLISHIRSSGVEKTASGHDQAVAHNKTDDALPKSLKHLEGAVALSPGFLFSSNFFEKITTLDVFLAMILWGSGIFFSHFAHMVSVRLHGFILKTSPGS